MSLNRYSHFCRWCVFIGHEYSIVQDGPQLYLTCHIILSMRVHKNKLQDPVCRNKLILLYLRNLLLVESYAPELNHGPRTKKCPCEVYGKTC